MDNKYKKVSYKNHPYEKYCFISGFCIIILILIHGITTILKELHEKNMKEKELETTISKLRVALDHDFSSFRNDMSDKISGLREDFEVSTKRFGKSNSQINRLSNKRHNNKDNVNNQNNGNQKDSSNSNKKSQPLPCLLVHSSSRPSFRICTLDPSIHAVSKIIHSSGHLELVSHWPLRRLLQGIADPLVVDVGSGLGYLALQACSLGARVISVEEDVGLANLIRTSIGLNNGQLKGTIHVIQGITNTKSSYEKNEITIDGIVGIKDVHLLHVSSRGNGAIASLLGASKLLSSKRVRYILLELCPTKSMSKFNEDPLTLLTKLISIGYNIFDDETAEDGALTKPELSLLLHGIKKGECKHIFIARAS